MKVFSRTLTVLDLHRAMNAAHDAGTIPEHVMLGEVHLRRTQTAGLHALEFRLLSTAKVPGDGRRRRNSGAYGADDEWAATYDEHGHWMAQVFVLDPKAAIGWSPRTPMYNGVGAFHLKTKGAYSLTEANA